MFIVERMKQMKNRFFRLLSLIIVCMLFFSTVNAEELPVDISELTVEELLLLQDAIKDRLEEMGHATYYDLERGAKGEEVSAIQERLAELGYYTGKITGKFDSETQKAFKSFEKANELSNDGIASREDQIILFGDVVVSKSTLAPSVNATIKPSNDKKESVSAVPEFLVEVTSCWAPNTGINGVTLYVPYLKAKVTNQRGKEASKITVDAVFYNESTKELWDDETYYLVRNGEVALKNGYSKTAFIKSSVGYQSRINELLLPTITAEIYVNGVIYDRITVDNVYE